MNKLEEIESRLPIIVFDSDALNKLIQLSYIGEKRHDMNITAQRLTRKALVEIMETITEKMRNLLE